MIFPPFFLLSYVSLNRFFIFLFFVVFFPLLSSFSHPNYLSLQERKSVWLHGRDDTGSLMTRGEGVQTVLPHSSIKWDGARMLQLGTSQVQMFHDAFLLTLVRVEVKERVEKRERVEKTEWKRGRKRERAKEGKGKKRHGKIGKKDAAIFLLQTKHELYN